MKPQVPDLLVKFYKKHDPAVHLHEIKTTDLPEIDTLYRDNTTGIVWKVLAHSGADAYEPTPTKTNYLGYFCENTSLVNNERERLVILQSVEPEGATMHVAPKVLKQRIHSSEHYAVVVKAITDIDRFTKLDELESDALPFWKRGVKTLDTEKTLHVLADAHTTSLYVINVYPTPHGLADLLIEYMDGNSTIRSPRIAKVSATWLPQDLLASIPKDALIKSQTFRRYLDGGFIKVLTNASVNRIKETPEYQAEAERMNLREPKHHASVYQQSPGQF